MTEGKAFLSYVQADNEAEHGRIVSFAEDVKKQYKLITSDNIELFIDRNDLTPGDIWKKKIDEFLLHTRYFMPIITPSYFSSAPCRNEFNYFHSKCEEIGNTELIIPIYYADVDLIEMDETTDEIAKIIKELQWVDMRDLRFEDENSPSYRKEIYRIAKKIQDVSNTIIESREVTQIPTPNTTRDENYGELDFLVSTEKSIPQFIDKINYMGEIITEIAEISRAHTPNNTASWTFVQRLQALKQLSEAIEPKANEFYQTSYEYLESLHSMDPGIRLLINKINMMAESPEKSKAEDDLFGPIIDLSEKAELAANNTNQASSSFRQIGDMSKEAKPVMSTITSGFTLFKEGVLIINNWKDLIIQSKLN